jgi:hypothetical protein
MRAALLPYPGDPYLLNYWLELFDTVWGKEVDALYIGLNSPIEPAMKQYIQDRIIKSALVTGKKIVIDYQNMMADHGPTINRLLDLVTEEHVMLVEDDGFIFKPGRVDSCFKLLETDVCDIVGSKRGSCHPEILIAAQEKWGLAYEGEGDQGPNFWPNFFFSSKELLLRTDRNFAAKQWVAGDILPGMDHIVTNEAIHGDTFVNTSLQLRGIVPIDRIFIVNQYHGSPEDLDHARSGRYLFDGQAPWTHVGSLSSGVGGVLRDDKNRHLDKRTTAATEAGTHLELAWCKTAQERREWERRVQWWATFWEFAKPTPETAEFYELYGNAVQQIIDQYDLNIANIRERQQVYKKTFNLP